MTEQDKSTPSEQNGPPGAEDTVDEFAELEQAIRRRLRSNQRFLERFLEEDFEDDEILPDEEDEASDEGEA